MFVHLSRAECSPRPFFKSGAASSCASKFFRRVSVRPFMNWLPNYVLYFVAACTSGFSYIPDSAVTGSDPAPATLGGPADSLNLLPNSISQSGAMASPSTSCVSVLQQSPSVAQGLAFGASDPAAVVLQQQRAVAPIQTQQTVGQLGLPVLGVSTPMAAPALATSTPTHKKPVWCPPSDVH